MWDILAQPPTCAYSTHVHRFTSVSTFSFELAQNPPDATKRDLPSAIVSNLASNVSRVRLLAKLTLTKKKTDS